MVHDVFLFWALLTHFLIQVLFQDLLKQQALMHLLIQVLYQDCFQVFSNKLWSICWSKCCTKIDSKLCYRPWTKPRYNVPQQWWYLYQWQSLSRYTTKSNCFICWSKICSFNYYFQCWFKSCSRHCTKCWFQRDSKYWSRSSSRNKSYTI